MINEKGIATRYLKSQKKRTVLLVFGVILAIALVSTVFSILNVLQVYEYTQESENGVWHVMAGGCDAKTSAALSHRADVSASGLAADVGNISFGKNLNGDLIGCDSGGYAQLNKKLLSGKFPAKDNEIALEQWAADKIKKGMSAGGSVNITLQNGTSKTFILSGILKNHTSNRESGYIQACIPLSAAQKILKTDAVNVYVQVKNGESIDAFVKSIQENQHISKSSVLQHTSLLTTIGRSGSQNSESIYLVGGFLALLVLFAAVMMIYNAFNISITQRVKQFGLLRAIGSTPKQIRALVKSEAMLVSVLGVLPGALLGIAVSNALLLLLRTMMPEYFISEGPKVYVSWVSVAIGIFVGIAATFISSLLPAKKAGKISPVEAISQSGGKSVRKKHVRGLLTKIVPIEAAISQRRLMFHKKSFILTSVSISLGILLMLCFSPLNDMISIGTQHNFDLGDIYIAGTKSSSFSDGVLNSIKKIGGVNSVKAERITDVNATFAYSLLGGDYKESVQKKTGKSVKADINGFVKAPSKSTLIGISDSDIYSLKSKLVLGKLNPDTISRENGVILALNYFGGVRISDLRPGDYININGHRMKICAVINNDAMMYAYSEKPFIGMYTTNKVFKSVSGINPNFATINLKSGANSALVLKKIQSSVKDMKNVRAVDQSEAQDISRRVTLVGDVFIFGFIAIIALIGILNIINTMSTNILTRTREIGLLRAGGMTMGQVTAMVVSESALYGIMALIIGLCAGLPLEKKFFILMIKRLYGVPWSLPWNLIIISSVITIAAVILSIISPLKYIKKIDITEAVTLE